MRLVTNDCGLDRLRKALPRVRNAIITTISPTMSTFTTQVAMNNPLMGCSSRDPGDRLVSTTWLWVDLSLLVWTRS